MNETPVTAPTAFIIPADVAQAVFNYLSARPYREVAGLIQALGTLKPKDGQAADGS